MWHKVATLPLENESKELGFELSCGHDEVSGFVIYSLSLERWFAYVNQCPHQSLPLNWQPHQFLDKGHDFIVCSMHMALFSLDKGECVHGACVGQFLKSLTVKQEDGALWVACPESVINS